MSAAHDSAAAASRARRAAQSAKPLKVRAAPREWCKLECESYTRNFDAKVFTPLLSVRDPKVADFERLFDQFERAFFETRDPLDETLPPRAVRILVAVHRCAD